MMTQASTEEKFHSAVELIKSLPKTGSIQPSNDTKLKFYSFYKQATEGPCELPKPVFWEIVNRAKWEAWNKLGDMSREEAMKSYVESFVSMLQQYSLNDLEDPSVLNEYVTLMGPYIEFAPKEIQEIYLLTNGKAKMPLNNNLDDHLETVSNEFKIDSSNKPSDGFSVNGHKYNGNNESDSDEYSDTLERVHEEEPSELSHGKPLNNSNPLMNSKGPNIVNVRGGGDHRVGPSDSHSPGNGPPESGGNHSSRQLRDSSYALQSASNSRLIGGAGGSRRSGGDMPSELSSDVGEQLALAVIRLQHIMEQVVVRLDSLEALLTEKRYNNSLPVTKNSTSRWTFLGISPKLAIIILAWPFIAQWLMYLIRKRPKTPVIKDDFRFF